VSVPVSVTEFRGKQNQNESNIKGTCDQDAFICFKTEKSNANTSKYVKHLGFCYISVI